MTEPTTEKLAKALEAAGAPAEMIKKAREGYYDDYKSPLAFPEMQLHQDAHIAGLDSIKAAVEAGEFDATKEESDEWARSPEGQAAFEELTKPRQNRAQRRHPPTKP
jgi:hypothetical protein